MRFVKLEIIEWENWAAKNTLKSIFVNTDEILTLERDESHRTRIRKHFFHPTAGERHVRIPAFERLGSCAG